MNKKIVPSTIVLATLWLAMYFLPLSKVENPYTYVTQFLADLKGNLAEDGNPLWTLVFQTPFLATAILSVVHAMIVLDMGGSLKTIKILSWVALILNIVLSGITYMVAKSDNTQIAAINVIVPILLLVYAIMINQVKAEKGEATGV